MNVSVQVLVFLVAAGGLAIMGWPLMRTSASQSWLRLIVCGGIFITPCAIAPGHVLLRALACVIAAELYFKGTDYARQINTSPAACRSFSSYLRFLLPFPFLLVRYGARQRDQKRNGTWSVPVFSLPLFLLCVLCVQHTQSTAALRESFLLDHTVKFVIFAVAIEALGRLVYWAERTAGFQVTPLIDHAYRSRTVGEFWSRYNTRVHSWLEANIFRPARSRVSSAQGVFLTFFVSAVLHEVGFAIATSRLDGYQFAFFLMQAPAVLVGHHFEQLVRLNTGGKIALQGATILWMWATSMLFFHGVDRVFPFFYVSTPWLP